MGSQSDDEIINRAKRAYYLAAKQSGVDPEVPDKKSGIRTIGDLKYVVLQGPKELYAVYRIRNDGKLKRIKSRIPAELL